MQTGLQKVSRTKVISAFKFCFPPEAMKTVQVTFQEHADRIMNECGINNFVFRGFVRALVNALP